MKFVLVLAVVILAVALAKPHHKKGSDSSSEELHKKGKHHGKHHGHHHGRHTSSVPFTEQSVAPTGDVTGTSELPQPSTEAPAITTAPAEVVTHTVTDAVATNPPTPSAETEKPGTSTTVA